MSEKEKSIPANWETSKKSINASKRANQVTFELKGDTPDVIRVMAANNKITPSDQIRSIIGLPVKTPKRPRMSISLSKEDYKLLANRYNLSQNNKENIHSRIKSEIEQSNENKDSD